MDVTVTRGPQHSATTFPPKSSRHPIRRPDNDVAGEMLLEKRLIAEA